MRLGVFKNFIAEAVFYEIDEYLTWNRADARACGRERDDESSRTTLGFDVIPKNRGNSFKIATPLPHINWPISFRRCHGEKKQYGNASISVQGSHHR